MCATEVIHFVCRLDGVNRREEKTNNEYEQARKLARKAKKDFEKVKNERLKRFNDCFETVSAKIDDIYKLLSRNNVCFCSFCDRAQMCFLPGGSSVPRR
jgi:chromosome segregation ATPase